MNQVIEILIGLPASGKSTYAKQKISENPNLWTRTNKDDIRKELGFTSFSKDNEKKVVEVENERITQALKDGKSVICDNTHLAKVHVYERFPEILKQFPEVKMIVNDSFLKVSFEECLLRNDLREGIERVPIKAMLAMKKLADDWSKEAKQSKQNNYYWLNKDYHNDDKSKAIIVDLDGTLCLHNGRSPYDETDKILTDIVNEPVATLLTIVHEFNNVYYKLDNRDSVRIIFCSGRKEKTKEITQTWIEDNFLWSGKSYDLYMRKDDDNRKDAIIKEEIYLEKIKPFYKVDFVIDDRKQVVNKWRELGLFVFDVNQSGEDF